MGAHTVGDYIMILLAIVVRFGLAELNFKLTNSCFPSGFGYVAEYHIVCYPRNSFSSKNLQVSQNPRRFRPKENLQFTRNIIEKLLNSSIHLDANVFF